MFRGIIFVIFAGIMAIGVLGKYAHAQEAAELQAKEIVNVGNKVCPVGGEKIEEAIKATYEYEGKIYNFCCAMCIDEFKKDPQKYIKKIEEEMQKEQK